MTPGGCDGAVQVLELGGKLQLLGGRAAATEEGGFLLEELGRLAHCHVSAAAAAEGAPHLTRCHTWRLRCLDRV